MSRKNLSHTLSAPFVRHHEFNSLSLQQKSDIKNIYHMKKLHLILMAALVAIAATAAPLSPQEALNRLKESNENAGAKTHSITINPTLSRTFTTSHGQPAIYAFTALDGTTLFVGGDDVAMPLIGYTKGAVSDVLNLPPAMLAWLNSCAKDIETASHSAVKAVSLTTSASYDKGKAVAPLITTAWDQRAPYYDLCPEYNGQTCITGCGATAMAQVMKHFQHPKEYGTGSIEYHPDSWDNEETLSMDFSTVRFDWASMRDTYTGDSYTEAEGKAVAELMKACGYAIRMDYTPNSSSSSLTDIGTALTENFGYSSNLTFKARNYCSTEDWYALHYKSLEAGSPIIYRASDATGGHIFICDGSDGEGYFHFNWGWGGYKDTYFLLNALNPNYIQGGCENSYSSGQMAIFNIRPKAEGEAHEPLRLSLNSFLRLTQQDGMLTITGEGDYFLINRNISELYADIAIELQAVDESGADKGEPVYMPFWKSLHCTPNYGYTFFNIPTAAFADIPAGIYRLRMVTMDLNAESPSWTRPEHNDYTTDYAYMTKNGDGTISVSQAPIFKDINFKAFRALTPLMYSSPVKLYAEIENTGDKTVTISLTPSITNATIPGEGSTADVTWAEQPVILTLKPGEVRQHEWITQFHSNKEITEPSAAMLSLYEDACSYPPEIMSTETTLYPHGTPKVTDFKIEGCEMRGGKYIVTDPSEMVFTANIGCEENAYSEQIYLYFYQNHYDYCFDYIPAPITFTKAGEPQKFSVTASTPSYWNGYTFHAVLTKNAGGELLPLYSAPDNLSSDLSLEFTIDTTTGIGNAVVNNAQPFTICNAQGMTVKANATRADLDALPQGLYIIKQGDKAAAYRR